MQHYTSTLVDTFGNAISGATVTVYTAGTVSLATIYSDNLSTSTSNPLTTGADGSFDFYAADGRYDLVMAHPSYTFTAADTAGIVLLDQTVAPTAWIPSVGGNATYTTQFGYYIKIGRLVFVHCTLVINVLGTGSASTISGLPVAVWGTTDGTLTVTNSFSLAVSPVALGAIADAGAQTVRLVGRTAGATSVSTLSALGNGSQVDFSGFYFSAS